MECHDYISRTIAYMNKRNLMLASGVLAVTTLFAGTSVFTSVANALVTSQYDLSAGALITSGATSSDTHTYIVSNNGYKRYVINPVILGMYGHLSAGNIQMTTSTVLGSFNTSGLYRDCESGAQPVYALEVTGATSGTLHWVNVTGDQAVAQDSSFFAKIFCINDRELSYYAQGSNYTAINQIPSYSNGMSQ